MIPAGYMAKRIASVPDWITTEKVIDVYSVSGCISENFEDYIHYWKHNGFWFFDSAGVVAEVAKEARASLAGTKLFYYEVHENEFNQEERRWQPFTPEESSETNVATPVERRLEGYDVVSFSAHTSPECSPLSCNNLAESLPVNDHCLFSSFEEACRAVEDGAFTDGEPGPLRIYAVYSVPESTPN